MHMLIRTGFILKGGPVLTYMSFQFWTEQFKTHNRKYVTSWQLEMKLAGGEERWVCRYRKG